MTLVIAELIKENYEKYNGFVLFCWSRYNSIHEFNTELIQRI